MKVKTITEQDKKEMQAMVVNAYTNKQSSKKPRIRVQSGQDLTGKIDFSDWEELR